jgi:hypothetical protein
MDAPLPLAGRYRFLRQLQGASSGVIWLASDSVAGRTVVASSVTSTRVAGLKRSVGLSHPHLATILDMFDDISPGQIPGRMALRPGMGIAVAEYVAGQTLHEQLESGRLSPNRAVGMIAKLANALYLLHSEGGVHGALSTRSIVIARTDGGVVPVLTNLRAAANGAYCSPERVKGAGPSAEDDTWALHATLFAVLTGHPPYQGKTREELANSILSGLVPNLAANGVRDDGLQFVLQDGLRTDWGSRLRSVAGLEKALVGWLRNHPADEPASVSAVVAKRPSGDDDDGEGVPTVALTMAEAQKQIAEEQGDDDQEEEDLDDDEMATIQLDPGGILADAIHRHGSPLGLEDPSLGDQVPTEVMSAPVLDAMVQEIRAQAARARDPLPSDTRSMEIAAVDAMILESVQDLEREASEFAGQTTPDGEDDEEDSTRVREPAFGSPVAGGPPPPVQASPAGPQRGWGPAEPTPPHIDPGALLPQIEQAQASANSGSPEDGVGFIDPVLAQPPVALPMEALEEPAMAPRKKRGLGWIILGGLLLMILAAALSFVVAVVVAGGDLPAPLASVLGRHTAVPAASSASPPAPVAQDASEPKTDLDAPDAPDARRMETDATPAASNLAPGPDAAPESLAGPELRACVKDFFPEGTFIREVPFDYVCTNDDPRKAAGMLHQQLVRGGAGTVTTGMKIWSSLSWYELPVVVMIRETCCLGAAPIDLPDPGKPCGPMTEALKKVTRGGCTQEAAKERASSFEESIRCLYANDVPRPYRYQGTIRPQQRMAFEEFLKLLPPARCTSP